MLGPRNVQYAPKTPLINVYTSIKASEIIRGHIKLRYKGRLISDHPCFITSAGKVTFAVFIISTSVTAWTVCVRLLYSDSDGSDVRRSSSERDGRSAPNCSTTVFHTTSRQTQGSYSQSSLSAIESTSNKLLLNKVARYEAGRNSCVVA